MGIKPKHKIIFVITLLSIIQLLIVPLLPAQTYYADISIVVDSSGFVTIQGPTNYPNLTIQNTQNYTSMQHSLWLLNITKPDIFSQFVYTVTLPKGSSINHIKSTGLIRITENQGNLVITGFGENESLSILIQYQIAKPGDVFLQDAKTIVYPILFTLILLVCVLLVYFFRKDKKTKPLDTKEEPLDDWKGLNHRQKQIMQLLKERNLPLTQTDLQKELQIPKASVSRNVRSLEKKGLIEKETIGMSNLIRLKKP